MHISKIINHHFAFRGFYKTLDKMTPEQSRMTDKMENKLRQKLCNQAINF